MMKNICLNGIIDLEKCHPFGVLTTTSILFYYSNVTPSGF